MMNNQNIEQKIRELKRLIMEAREMSCNNIADLFADELQTLLANEELVGNKPRRG